MTTTFYTISNIPSGVRILIHRGKIQAQIIRRMCELRQPLSVTTQAKNFNLVYNITFLS